MKSLNPVKILSAIVITLIVVVAFELGVYITTKKPQVAGVSTNTVDTELLEKLKADLARTEEELLSNEAELELLNSVKSEQSETIDTLESELAGRDKKQTELAKQIQQLEQQISNIRTSQVRTTNRFPFVTPTNGTLATDAGSFNGNLYGTKHLGIDIWTSTSNNGRIAGHKGNPVYSACDGTVNNIYVPNAAVTISCDELDQSFNVPQHKVYTHYSHMGHAETKELYILVHGGKRVKAGDKIGYQGDLSSYYPSMRNVHLHFSVFTGLSETDPNGGAIDPCLYIGGSCDSAGYVFKV